MLELQTGLTWCRQRSLAIWLYFCAGTLRDIPLPPSTQAPRCSAYTKAGREIIWPYVISAIACQGKQTKAVASCERKCLFLEKVNGLEKQERSLQEVTAQIQPAAYMIHQGSLSGSNLAKTKLHHIGDPQRGSRRTSGRGQPAHCIAGRREDCNFETRIKSDPVQEGMHMDDDSTMKSMNMALCNIKR